MILQQSASVMGGMQQYTRIEGDTINGNINSTSLATVDNTLLQTLQDHMIQCAPTPYNPSSAGTPNCFGVLCFEDDLCLGEVLLSSPVLVIDGSNDDSIMSRIGFGGFPTCNLTSSYVEHRDHIGLVLPYMVIMILENMISFIGCHDQPR